MIHLIRSKIKSQFQRIPSFDDLMIPNLIEEHIYLGDVDAANSTEMLRAMDIKCVLSVFNENLENHYPNITYKLIWVDDFYLEEIMTHFPEANEYIGNAQRVGHNVLVHCHMGVSRSATIVIAFLMNKYKIPFKEAYDRVNIVLSI